MLFAKHKHNRIITGLDIGTTKVCTIIGQADEDGKISVLGMGSCPSTGLRCGEIINIQPTINAIVESIDIAVQQASVPVDEVYVGIAGEHIQSHNAKALVEIRHPARGIDEKDRRRAVAKARDAITPSAEKTRIHSIIQEFRVNNGNPTSNPIGLSGSNLEVSAHFVLSDIDPLHNIIRCVRRAGLRQPHVVLQSLASSMSVITPTEQELGTVLIDIGGGTTDVAISTGGAIRYTTEVSLGGDHVTEDVTHAFECSFSDAERIKKRNGCALPSMVERGRTFELPSVGDACQLNTFEEWSLANVIEARLEDIFCIVRDRIEQSGLRTQIHAGAVITGGSSLIEGVTDVAERILEMKCRRGHPNHGLKGLSNVVQSPVYSTATGLILYGMDQERGIEDIARESLPIGGMGGVRRFLDYLVEMFT